MTPRQLMQNHGGVSFLRTMDSVALLAAAKRELHIGVTEAFLHYCMREVRASIRTANDVYALCVRQSHYVVAHVNLVTGAGRVYNSVGPSLSDDDTLLVQSLHTAASDLRAEPLPPLTISAVERMARQDVRLPVVHVQRLPTAQVVAR